MTSTDTISKPISLTLQNLQTKVNYALATLTQFQALTSKNQSDYSKEIGRLKARLRTVETVVEMTEEELKDTSDKLDEITETVESLTTFKESIAQIFGNVIDPMNNGQPSRVLPYLLQLDVTHVFQNPISSAHSIILPPGPGQISYIVDFTPPADEYHSFCAYSSNVLTGSALTYTVDEQEYKNYTIPLIKPDKYKLGNPNTVWAVNIVKNDDGQVVFKGNVVLNSPNWTILYFGSGMRNDTDDDESFMLTAFDYALKINSDNSVTPIISPITINFPTSCHPVSKGATLTVIRSSYEHLYPLFTVYPDHKFAFYNNKKVRFTPGYPDFTHELSYITGTVLDFGVSEFKSQLNTVLQSFDSTVISRIVSGQASAIIKMQTQVPTMKYYHDLEINKDIKYNNRAGTITRTNTLDASVMSQLTVDVSKTGAGTSSVDIGEEIPTSVSWTIRDLNFTFYPWYYNLKITQSTNLSCRFAITSGVTCTATTSIEEKLDSNSYYDDYMYLKITQKQWLGTTVDSDDVRLTYSMNGTEYSTANISSSVTNDGLLSIIFKLPNTPTMVYPKPKSHSINHDPNTMPESDCTTFTYFNNVPEDWIASVSTCRISGTHYSALLILNSEPLLTFGALEPDTIKLLKLEGKLGILQSPGNVIPGLINVNDIYYEQAIASLSYDLDLLAQTVQNQQELLDTLIEAFKPQPFNFIGAILSGVSAVLPTGRALTTLITASTIIQFSIALAEGQTLEAIVQGIQAGITAAFFLYKRRKQTSAKISSWIVSLKERKDNLLNSGLKREAAWTVRDPLKQEIDEFGYVLKNESSPLSELELGAINSVITRKTSTAPPPYADVDLLNDDPFTQLGYRRLSAASSKSTHSQCTSQEVIPLLGEDFDVVSITSVTSGNSLNVAMSDQTPTTKSRDSIIFHPVKVPQQQVKRTPPELYRLNPSVASQADLEAEFKWYFRIAMGSRWSSEKEQLYVSQKPWNDNSTTIYELGHKKLQTLHDWPDIPVSAMLTQESIGAPSNITLSANFWKAYAGARVFDATGQSFADKYAQAMNNKGEEGRSSNPTLTADTLSEFQLDRSNNMINQELYQPLSEQSINTIIGEQYRTITEQDPIVPPITSDVKYTYDNNNSRFGSFMKRLNYMKSLGVVA